MASWDSEELQQCSIDVLKMECQQNRAVRLLPGILRPMVPIKVKDGEVSGAPRSGLVTIVLVELNMQNV